jgi:c-di-GMP-binding flagellar brake protein YcgR
VPRSPGRADDAHSRRVPAQSNFLQRTAPEELQMDWSSGNSSERELAALSAACARSTRLRLRLLALRSEGRTIYTRFVALRDQDVLVYWPANGALEFTEAGAPVEGYFEHNGVRYAFLSEVLGRQIHVLDNDTKIIALQLSRPDRLEKRQQREAFRVSLSDLVPIEADLVELLPEGGCGSSWAMRLINISTGGVGGLMNCTRLEVPQRRTVCDATFRLPGDPNVFRCTLELRHVRRIGEEGDRWYAGWRLCPSDDVRKNREQQRLLERFVAERQRAAARRAATGSTAQS